MFSLIIRFILRVLPALYILGIWLQSSYFNPEAIGQFSSKITHEMVIMFGITFELAHLIQFGILYLLLIICYLTYGELNKMKESIAIFISIGYGLIDEIHQIFVPFRSFSIIDLIKDVIGVLAIWYFVNKYYYKNTSSKFGSFLKRIKILSNQNRSM